MAFKLKFWKKDNPVNTDLGGGADPLKSNPSFDRGQGFGEKPFDTGLGNVGAGSFNASPAPMGGDMGTIYLGSAQKDSPGQEAMNITPLGTPLSARSQTPQYMHHSLQSSQMHQDPDYIYGLEKDLEVISAKLDSIRAMLESLNQRVANIERLAYGQQSQSTKDHYGNYKW